MTEPSLDQHIYDDAAVLKLRRFVENITGGEIVRMERQVRWRPAWFADVAREGEILHLHLRGDRAGDLAIFPELRREGDVMHVLGEHGIPVPIIYGYCEDPPCIVMEAIPGVRDVGILPTDRERASVAREYISAVAAMHQLPLAPFQAVGVHAPEGAEAIALVGLEAYLPHYRRTKSKPEPFLEFAQAWLRRNVPRHRTSASFIQFDSGQFHVSDGKLAGLYDFEFSMIGDPMVDLATMGMRDSIEPLGVPLAVICRYYEAATGVAVDHAVIDYHVLMFATLGTMQFAGTVGSPQTGDAHSIYLAWDLSLRQIMLLALEKMTGATPPLLPPLAAGHSGNAALIAKLADTIGAIGGASPLDDAAKENAADLLEWLGRADEAGDHVRAADIADVSALLGRDYGDWSSAEAALETYAKTAGPSEDAALLALFARIEGRRMQLFGPTRIGHSARHVAMPPTT